METFYINSNCQTQKKCLYCNHTNHTIKHLLWECPHVKPLWDTLEGKIQFKITYQHLIFGDQNKDQNNMFSVLLYIIYKKFIFDNTGSEERITLINYVKNDLKTRIAYYEVIHHTFELSKTLNEIKNYI